MKTTTDRLRARVERARKRVDGMNVRIGDHFKACAQCAKTRSEALADGYCGEMERLWCEVSEAIGRRKEAEAALREERRHG